MQWSSDTLNIIFSMLHVQELSTAERVCKFWQQTLQQGKCFEKWYQYQFEHVTKRAQLSSMARAGFERAQAWYLHETDYDDDVTNPKIQVPMIPAPIPRNVKFACQMQHDILAKLFPSDKKGRPVVPLFSMQLAENHIVQLLDMYHFMLVVLDSHGGSHLSDISTRQWFHTIQLIPHSAKRCLLRFCKHDQSASKHVYRLYIIYELDVHMYTIVDDHVTMTYEVKLTKQWSILNAHQVFNCENVTFISTTKSQLFLIHDVSNDISCIHNNDNAMTSTANISKVFPSTILKTLQMHDIHVARTSDTHLHICIVSLGTTAYASADLIHLLVTIDKQGVPTQVQDVYNTNIINNVDGYNAIAFSPSGCYHHGDYYPESYGHIRYAYPTYLRPDDYQVNDEYDKNYGHASAWFERYLLVNSQGQEQTLYHYDSKQYVICNTIPKLNPTILHMSNAGIPIIAQRNTIYISFKI